MLNRFPALATALIMTAALFGVSINAARAADTPIDDDLCTRLMAAADSPGTYHFASSACLQAAVGHKRLADASSGATRQRQLLLQAGFMTLAAQAESHGGDDDVRRQLLADAANIARSVRAHALTSSIKSDASRLLNNIAKL